MQPGNLFISLKDTKFGESNVRGCPDSPPATPQPAQLEPEAPGKDKDQVQVLDRIKLKVKPRTPRKKIRNLKSLKFAADPLTTRPKHDYKYLSKTGRFLFDDRFVQESRLQAVAKLPPKRERKKTWRACPPEEAPSKKERPSKKRKVAEEDPSKEESSSTEEPPSKKPKVANPHFPTPPDSPPYQNKEAVDKVVDQAVDQDVDQDVDPDYETYCHLATVMYARLQQH